MDHEYFTKNGELLHEGWILLHLEQFFRSPATVKVWMLYCKSITTYSI